MKLEPEVILFAAAAVLTVVVAVVGFYLVRHAFREEREQQKREGR